MNIFARAFDLIKQVGKTIAGKTSLAQTALTVLQSIPAILADVQAYKESDRFERIRQAWETFDDQLGVGGPDVLRDVPPEIEEQLFDGIKQAGLILSLWAAGYYAKDHQEPSADEIAAVSNAFLEVSGFGEVFKQLQAGQNASTGAVEPSQPESAPNGSAGADLPQQGVKTASLGVLVAYRQQLQKQQANPTLYTLAAQVETLQAALIALLPE